MAELDVQPKRSNPWWLWLLLALIALALLMFLFRGCNNKPAETASADTTHVAAADGVAVTTPDWNAVDFSSAAATDSAITDHDITVTGNGKYTIYTLGENVLFATDKTSLQGSAEAKLKQVVAALNKRYKNAEIGVYGSADSTGSDSHNKVLGAQRAGAVKNWLTTTGGLDAANVSIHTLGDTKPVASNATAGGRQQNRNVSIVAFPNN